MNVASLYSECCKRFEYIDGMLINKVNIPGSAKKKGDRAGYTDTKSGYRKIRVCGKMYQEHRIVYLMHHGYMPENEVDHIDRNRSNNKIDNLREVSRSCNARNSGTPANSATGVKGVFFDKSKQKYLSHVKVNGKKRYLGFFDNIVDAARRRLAEEGVLGFPDCIPESSARSFLDRNP